VQLEEQLRVIVPQDPQEVLLVWPGEQTPCPVQEPQPPQLQLAVQDRTRVPQAPQLP